MILIFKATTENEAFWGVSRDTVFTVLITLFVFILGILITRLIEARKEKKRLKELRVYFFTLAALLPKSLSKLVGEYKKLANDVLDPKSHNYFLPETHQLYLDNISKLSHTDIFKALVTERKTGDIKITSTHFKNIFDTFEYLRHQKERMRVNFTNFMAGASEYIDNWNNYMDALEQRLQELITLAKSQNIPPSGDDFLRDLDGVFFAWTQVEDYKNIFVAKENLLDPLKDFCNKYSADPRVTMFMPMVTKLRKAHNELKASNGLFGKLFQDEAQELEKAENLLTRAIEFFNQKTRN